MSSFEERGGAMYLMNGRVRRSTHGCISAPDLDGQQPDRDRDPNREVSGIKANSLLTRPEFHGRASTTLGFEITWLC